MELQGLRPRPPIHNQKWRKWEYRAVSISITWLVLLMKKLVEIPKEDSRMADREEAQGWRARPRSWIICLLSILVRSTRWRADSRRPSPCKETIASRFTVQWITLWLHLTQTGPHWFCSRGTRAFRSRPLTSHSLVLNSLPNLQSSNRWQWLRRSSSGSLLAQSRQNWENWLAYARKATRVNLLSAMKKMWLSTSSVLNSFLRI